MLHAGGNEFTGFGMCQVIDAGLEALLRRPDPGVSSLASPRRISSQAGPTASASMKLCIAKVSGRISRRRAQPITRLRPPARRTSRPTHLTPTAARPERRISSRPSLAANNAGGVAQMLAPSRSW